MATSINRKAFVGRPATAALVALALLACAGCGSAVHPVPVQGTITLDGSPLKGVQVLFDPVVGAGATTPPRSRAVSDDQGHYALKCDTGQDGAVPGKHRVTVMYAMSSHDQETALKSGKPPVPAKYTAAALTPLQIEVTPGQDTYDLQLKSKP